MHLSTSRNIVVGLFAGIVIAEAGPKIQFDKSVYDFGKSSFKGTTNGSFVVKNTGDAELVIASVAATCGCTVASLKEAKVPAGGSTTIDFTLNMPSFRRQLETQIVVSSNDPQVPSTNLTLKVDFVPLIELMPLVGRMDVRADQTTNISFNLTRTDGKPLTVSKVEASKPWLTAKYDGAKGASQGRVIVETKPSGSPRNFSEAVKVYGETTNEVLATAVITGRIVGDLVVSAERMMWPIGNPSKLTDVQKENIFTKKVQVYSSVPGKPLKLKSAVSSLKNITLTWNELPNGKGYELVAKVTDLPKDIVTGKITVIGDIGGSERRFDIATQIETFEN